MASNIETGNATNISNFKLLIDKCTAMGTTYQPSNPDLALKAMKLTWDIGSAAHDTLVSAVIAAKTLIAGRRKLFAEQNKLVTMLLKNYKSTKADKQLKSNAKTIADRIRGYAKPKAEDNPNDISVSHQSYVQKLDSFVQLVKLLASDPQFAPNEEHLKVSTIQSVADEMRAYNDNIGNIIAPIDNALIERDKALYADETGMMDISLACKDYVEGVYGAGTPNARLVRGIKFRKKEGMK